jgi:hypothetical protein
MSDVEGILEVLKYIVPEYDVVPRGRVYMYDNVGDRWWDIGTEAVLVD